MQISTPQRITNRNTPLVHALQPFCGTEKGESARFVLPGNQTTASASWLAVLALSPRYTRQPYTIRVTREAFSIWQIHKGEPRMMRKQQSEK